jgi:succinate dehydrogenase hydrophobic anchor subunit
MDSTKNNGSANFSKITVTAIMLLLTIIGFFLINIHMKVEKTYEFVITQDGINKFHEQGLLDIKNELKDLKNFNNKVK